MSEGRAFSVMADGLTYAGLEWGDPDDYPILALHGWLDNALSFSVLAPFADTIRGRLKALPASYFLKLVCLRQDGRILGVHVYGEGASELIHLGASLVADGNTVFDLQYKSFPAVTLHEVYRNAAMLAIDTLSGLAQKAG